LRIQIQEEPVMFKVLAFSALCVSALTTVSTAGVPELVHFQGVLEDDQGAPLDGSYSVTFCIYAQESGGTALWSETRMVDCEGGLFSVILGQDIPIALAFDSQYWLGCQLSGDPEMSPRYKLSTVPYAFWSAASDSSLRAGHAGVADWSTDAALADSANGVRWSNISGVPPDLADGDDIGDGDGHSLDAADGSPVDAVYVDAAGHVGVGTTTPSSELHVGGDIETDTEYIIGGVPVLSVPDTDNTLVGSGAGTNNSGNNTTMVGHNAGFYNSGQDNTFVGASAGNGNTSGNLNTFVGYGAGSGNQTGSNNTHIGTEAGRHITGGSNNVYLGYNTGVSMTSGSANSILGTEAGRAKTSGNDNTLVGFAAGYNNSSGSGNVFVGNKAGFNETGSNKLYIENSDATNPLVYGDFTSDVVGINGDFGVGTTSPAEEFHVVGEGRIDGILQVSGFYMPSGASNGYVLTSDASGVASWGPTSGGGDSDWTVSGNDMYSAVTGDVGIGTTSPAAKLDVLGTLNVGADAAGHDVSLYGGYSGGRVFWDADLAALRAGYDNFGYWITPDSVGMQSFAVGSDVKAIGSSAVAFGNISAARGNSSLAVGEAVTANGDYSAAIGGWCRAMGSYSLAMGENAEAGDVGACAIGSYVTADGSYAHAIGRYVKTNVASAFVIGKGTGYGSELTNSTTNSLMVGFNSDIPTLFVGSSGGSGTTGKVGVGTSSPDSEAKLHVRGSTDNFGILIDSEGTSGSEIGLHTANTEYSSLAKNCFYFGTNWYRYNNSRGAYVNEITPDGHVRFKVAGSGVGAITWATALAFRSDGNVGIGTTNPARPLHVSDVMRLQPRASAPGSPVEGDLYVNSSDHHIYCFLNGVWKQLD
jgi:hypothetical protein